MLHDFSDMVQGDCIGFSADGKEFLVLDQRGKEKEIVRFDTASGKVLGKTKLMDVEKEQGGTNFSILDDGRWLCMTEVYGNCAVWDVVTGKRQFRKKIDQDRGRPMIRGDVLTFYDGAWIGQYNVRTGEQISRKRSRYTLRELISNSSGKIWAAYSEDEKAIVFWDFEKDELVGTKMPIDWHDWHTSEAAISNDGKLFAFFMNADKPMPDRRYAIFDISSGKVVCAFEPKPDMYFLNRPMFSSDGRYVFLTGERAVFCPLEIATGKPVHEVPDHILAVNELSFTPDGKMLLVGSRDKRQAWHVDTGKPGVAFVESNRDSYAAAIDNEKTVVSGFRNGGLKVQKIESGAEVWQFGLETYGYLSALQLSTDRKTFVGIMNDQKQGGVVRRWDAATGKVVQEKILPKRGHDSDRGGWDRRYAIQGLAVGGSRLLRSEEARKGNVLADGSMDWGDTDLLLEDWTTMQVVNELRLPTPYFSHFADTAHGTALAGIGSDERYYNKIKKEWIFGMRYLVIWDVETGRELLRIKRDNSDYFSKFSLVATTRELQLVATANRHDHVDVWNAVTGEHLQEFDTGNDVTALAFSDYGSLLATGHADGRVNIWDTEAASDAAIDGRR